MAKSNVPSVDPQSAIGVARTVLARINQPSQQTRFGALPAGEFDQRVLSRYASLLEEAASAANAYTATLATEGEARVPVATVRDATAIRARMFACLEYMLASEQQSVRRQLDDIRSGTGYRDLGADLAALAALYQDHLTVLATDPKYRASDVADAVRLAGDLQEARIGSMSAPARKAAERWGKTFGELKDAHDEVCAAGRWLERKSGDPNRFYPSLYAPADGSGGKKGKGKKTPPGPTPPA